MMALIMAAKNCRQITIRIFAAMVIGAFASRGGVAQAHFIHIDSNEFRTVNGYAKSPPVYATVQAKVQTPSECMVDLTNDLAFRILHYHSILNRNNFAFSPSALMSVLVALYEGAAGRGSLEFRNVLLMPSDRDVIRVGYRDIHRRLRTYFFGSDNPLKGLSLNKENVTITRDYENLLMFYGFDLGTDMKSSAIMPTAASNDRLNVTMEAATTEKTDLNATDVTTTLQPNTTSSNEPFLTTTTTDIPLTTTITTIKPTTEQTSTEEMTTTATITTTVDAPADSETTTLETNVAVENDVVEIVTADGVTSSIGNGSSEAFKATASRNSPALSEKLIAPPVPVPSKSYLPAARKRATLRRQSNSTGSRSKRHLLSLADLNARLAFITHIQSQQSTTQQQHHHNFLPVSVPPPPSTAYQHKYNFDVFEPNFVVNAANPNFNTDLISHVFYLNSQEIVHTTFKVYNAVLYYKYFENLKMSILELELDTPEYNLMILLPDYGIDLVTAAACLHSGPTLRIMRKQLKPRWVQAIIPDFKLHGSMFLTNDLQNMGIRDIFEPNRADFRPMTDDSNVYVKHIEQAISVNIRTKPINNVKRNYGQQTLPIQLSVNHPFMFFIIDRDLDVATMAGRVLNPLNVRIQ